MERIRDYDAFYKTNNIYTALKRFTKKFPEVAVMTDFDEGHTNEEIISCLPITDMNLADGTRNNDWTYYFNIDSQEEGFYIWYIERA